MDDVKLLLRRALASRVMPRQVVEKLGIKHVPAMLVYGDHIEQALAYIENELWPDLITHVTKNSGSPARLIIMRDNNYWMVSEALKALKEDEFLVVTSEEPYWDLSKLLELRLSSNAFSSYVGPQSFLQDLSRASI